MKQRIAVVAVTALTAGFLSVVSTPAANAALTTANAANGTLIITSGTVCSVTNDAGSALAAGDTRVSSAAGINVVAPIGAIINVSVDSLDSVEIQGPLIPSGYDVDAGTDGAMSLSINSKGRLVVDDSIGTADDEFQVTTSAIGTATLVVAADGTGASTPTDVTTNSVDITVVASCASDVYTASKSFVYVKGSTAADAVVASSNVDVSTSASAGSSLFINITGKNTYGTALAVGTYAVSATNGALVNIGQAETTAPAKGTVSVITGTPDGIDIVRIDPASALVTSTTVVTITHNGTAVATKSLTFYGEAASIEVVATSAGALSTGVTADTATGFLMYQYKDTAGNVVPGGSASLDATTQTTTIPSVTAEKAPSASAAAVTGNLLTAIETAIDTVTYGVMSFGCGTTSGSSTVTIKHTNAISGATITKPAALTCAGGIDTYTVSLDKASYAVGEVATITITAKDSTGKPVHGAAAMGGANLVSVGGGSLTVASAANDVFTTGVRTYKAQMTTAGTFNTVVSIAGGTTKSATAKYTVTDGGVSNAEVLKSIVALIASINKQIQALQKLILKR
jgi:hypothetical protein